MASGTISFVTQGNLMGRIVWEAVSNGIAANTSTVLGTIQARKTSNTTVSTYGTWLASLTIGGKTETFSGYADVGSGSWVTLKSFSATVNHSTDGTGSCYISGRISAPNGTSLAGTAVSGNSTVTLDTIPRQAAIETAADFYDTDNPVIAYTNPLGSAVASLQAGISLTNTSTCEITYRNVDKTAGEDTLELTAAERDVLRSATTGQNYRTVWIYLRTKIGSTYYYSSRSVRFTIRNPKPAISPTIKDTNTKTIELTGDSSKLIKYFSKANVSIGAQAVTGSTITSKEVTCGSKKLTADGAIDAVESNKFVFTAKDSRGNTATLTKTVEMVEYIKLTCSQENTRPNTEGKITIKVKGACFGGSFGAVKNNVAVTVVYKKTGGAYGDPVTMQVTQNSRNYQATVDITGLDPDKTYVFKAMATDLLSSASSNERTVKLMPVFDWSGEDFNFNVPVTMQGNFVRAKRCRVGQSSDTSTNPWYKFASFKASSTNEEIRISFKVTFSYGGSTKFGILNATVRTERLDGIGAVQRLEFESDTGLDLTKFVLAYGGTGPGAVYELWVKLNAYQHCFFEVLSECSLSSYMDKWILYNTRSAGSAAEPTSGYTLVQATKPYILNAYPVGSYYICHESTSPAALFGGTWTQLKDRFLLAAGSIYTAGATGGSASHSLTIDEMPAHGHNLIRPQWYIADGDGTKSSTYNSDNHSIYGTTASTTQTFQDVNSASVEKTGGGKGHNNMPPYIAVYVWRRTA